MGFRRFGRRHWVLLPVRSLLANRPGSLAVAVFGLRRHRRSAEIGDRMNKFLLHRRAVTIWRGHPHFTLLAAITSSPPSAAPAPAAGRF
jgi:hypothetical protein